MTDDAQALAVEGVRFFGEMSASVSHEIKNVLAIINENAGLLQDLLAMNAKGIPLAPDRLAGLAQSIKRQVARGDRIVETMNRLAHSADHRSETVDVGEVIGFVINLAGRLIAMKGTTLQIETPAAPVTTVTNRFFLEDLVWTCLCRAMTACVPEQVLTIGVEQDDTIVRIHFKGLTMNFLAGSDGFPSPREAMVCRMLNAQLAADEKNGQLMLVLF